MGWALWSGCIHRQCGICRRASLANWMSSCNCHAGWAKCSYAFESKFRRSHMSHAYDFYKQNLASEFVIYCSTFEFEKLQGQAFSISDADYFVFHSPYNRLVQKSFARLFFNDFLRNASYIDEGAKEKLSPFSGLSND
ncbi:hypothetical protein CRYUN_Cryun07bG0095600 [Craigia yunnanensis]